MVGCLTNILGMAEKTVGLHEGKQACGWRFLPPTSDGLTGLEMTVLGLVSSTTIAPESPSMELHGHGFM